MEQIAIIGMACRLPGGVDSARRYWEFINEGTVAIADTPADRFDMASLLSSDPDEPGTAYCGKAGYLDAPYRFDAAFFKISDAEALDMDPQQRWLLELCWSALEDAGIAPSTLRGKRVGLYLTIGEADYGRRSMWSGDLRRITAYSKLGTNRAVAVGRVAHVLGFQGPAVFVDTACSSSLVAVHMAAQGLRADDCDIALAGGVNMILSPEEIIVAARLRAMSPTGACRPFDAQADGYIRGEGGGVLVLQREQDALAQGHRLEAILAGSAINNDGPSNGLTAPNGAAQEAVIRHALRQAGTAPEEVAYVETHGTGTPLGDPIELGALRNTYGRARGRGTPLWLGGVKAQIGHLEVAAGAAGLIKAILVMRHMRRDHWAHRAAVVGTDADEFIASLADFETGKDTGKWHAAMASGRRPVIFLFPGQGAWRPGVGAQLYEGNAVFRSEVDDCLGRLDRASADDALAAIRGIDPARVRHHPGQLAHFIVLYALARLWIKLGVQPAAVLGHSLGEHAAAAIAGVTSLDDALRIVEARGRLFDRLAPRGAMLAVGADEKTVEAMLDLGTDLWIAAYNGPGQTVLSGTVDAVGRAQVDMEAAGLRISRVQAFDVAGHSPMLLPLREPFREVLDSVDFHSPSIRLISTLTGTDAAQDLCTPEHWLDLMERPVRFTQAMATIAGENALFLEVGPGAGLSNQLRRAVADRKYVVSTLSDGPEAGKEPEATGLAHACARVYCLGFSIDWAAFEGEAFAPVAVPPYAFAPIHLELPSDEDTRGIRSGSRRRHKRAPRIGADAMEAALPPAAASAPAAPVSAGLSADTLLARVCEMARQMGTRAQELDTDTPLVDQGFDSLSITELRSRMQQSFGSAPPVTLFINGVSPRGLADYYENIGVRGEVAAQASRDDDTDEEQTARSVQASALYRQTRSEDGLVLTLREGKLPAIALVHPIGGDVLCYTDLVRVLPGDEKIVAIRHPELAATGVPAYRSIPALAVRYRQALADALGGVPACMIGWSMGGVVAQEMIRQWEDERVAAPGLMLVDSPFANGPYVTMVKEFLCEVGDVGASDDDVATMRLYRDDRFRAVLDETFDLSRLNEIVGAELADRIAWIHVASSVALARHRIGAVTAALGYALALRGQNASGEEQARAYASVFTRGEIAVAAFAEDHNSIIRGESASAVAAFLAGNPALMSRREAPV